MDQPIFVARENYWATRKSLEFLRKGRPCGERLNVEILILEDLLEALRAHAHDFLRITTNKIIGIYILVFFKFNLRDFFLTVNAEISPVNLIFKSRTSLTEKYVGAKIGGKNRPNAAP